MNKYNSSDFFKMAGIKASIDIETYERDMKEKEKELDKYKNIIEEIDNKLCSTWQIYYDHSRLTTFKCEDMLELIEQIRNDIKKLKGE